LSAKTMNLTPVNGESSIDQSISYSLS